MAIVRTLDGDNDWTFGAGINNYRVNKNAVAQNIQTRLNSFIGDCYFDLKAGLDWFNLLGCKDPISLNLAISATILNTAYVVKLTQLNIRLDSATRNIEIDYEVLTAFGAVGNTAAISPTAYLTTQSGSPIITQSGERIPV